MHNHFTEYNLGDIVYLKTDPDQLQRMVVAITIRPTGILYELSQAASGSDHYSIEISPSPDLNLKMGIENNQFTK
ncbi:hypothetical protein SNE25_21085 [Mucilaginibacter sabulilitoris]|uniref:DUF4926 domain-containing protein n=1 Tax=Mucilaginibacter sabulilitoris TaxID=1173583 RepID=A0ABZ0TF62_9SPHI|nr:hypothetical protein [Mucilaginibacter sabulilitoris]WPU91815.1 hypothetical protein SNE25_21085 [Mucilaginibacter sabulilitoris]